MVGDCDTKVGDSFVETVGGDVKVPGGVVEAIAGGEVKLSN